MRYDLYDKCVLRIQELREAHKLYIRNPYKCLAQHYFVDYYKTHSGIVVSTVEGDAGTITRVWGIVFVDPDKPLRCTEVHVSYYGEGEALRKLLKELENV